MNVYGDWWSYTVTLYNKVVGSNGKTKWYKHTIEECFYNHTIDKITINNTTLQTDVSVCRIKVSDKYVSKRAYLELSEEDREKYFTLSTDDIIVADDVDFEIDDYVQGQRSSDLLKLYKEDPGCFTVYLASNNTGHGRGNEHYLARGV